MATCSISDNYVNTCPSDGCLGADVSINTVRPDCGNLLIGVLYLELNHQLQGVPISCGGVDSDMYPARFCTIDATNGRVLEEGILQEGEQIVINPFFQATTIYQVVVIDARGCSLFVETNLDYLDPCPCEENLYGARLRWVDGQPNLCECPLPDQQIGVEFLSTENGCEPYSDIIFLNLDTGQQVKYEEWTYGESEDAILIYQRGERWQLQVGDCEKCTYSQALPVIPICDPCPDFCLVELTESAYQSPSCDETDPLNPLFVFEGQSISIQCIDGAEVDDVQVLFDTEILDSSNNVIYTESNTVNCSTGARPITAAVDCSLVTDTSYRIRTTITGIVNDIPCLLPPDLFIGKEYFTTVSITEGNISTCCDVCSPIEWNPFSAVITASACSGFGQTPQTLNIDVAVDSEFASCPDCCNTFSGNGFYRGFDFWVNPNPGDPPLFTQQLSNNIYPCEGSSFPVPPIDCTTLSPGDELKYTFKYVWLDNIANPDCSFTGTPLDIVGDSENPTTYDVTHVLTSEDLECCTCVPEIRSISITPALSQGVGNDGRCGLFSLDDIEVDCACNDECGVIKLQLDLQVEDDLPSPTTYTVSQLYNVDCTSFNRATNIVVAEFTNDNVCREEGATFSINTAESTVQVLLDTCSVSLPTPITINESPSLFMSGNDFGICGTTDKRYTVSYDLNIPISQECFDDGEGDKWSSVKYMPQFNIDCTPCCSDAEVTFDYTYSIPGGDSVSTSLTLRCNSVEMPWDQYVEIDGACAVEGDVFSLEITGITYNDGNCINDTFDLELSSNSAEWNGEICDSCVEGCNCGTGGATIKDLYYINQDTGEFDINTASIGMEFTSESCVNQLTDIYSIEYSVDYSDGTTVSNTYLVQPSDINLNSVVATDGEGVTIFLEERFSGNGYPEYSFVLSDIDVSVPLCAGGTIISELTTIKVTYNDGTSCEVSGGGFVCNESNIQYCQSTGSYCSCNAPTCDDDYTCETPTLWEPPTIGITQVLKTSDENTKIRVRLDQGGCSDCCSKYITSLNAILKIEISDPDGISVYSSIYNYSCETTSRWINFNAKCGGSTELSSYGKYTAEISIISLTSYIPPGIDCTVNFDESYTDTVSFNISEEDFPCEDKSIPVKVTPTPTTSTTPAPTPPASPPALEKPCPDAFLGDITTAGTYSDTAQDSGFFVYNFNPQDTPTYIEVYHNGTPLVNAGCIVDPTTGIDYSCHDQHCDNVSVSGTISGSFEYSPGDTIVVEIVPNCCNLVDPIIGVYCANESDDAFEADVLCQYSVTPTPTPTTTTTPTVTPTISPGSSPTPSPTFTPTPSVTPSTTPDVTPTPSVTPAVSPTQTPFPTPTPSRSSTPAPTPSMTSTPTLGYSCFATTGPEPCTFGCTLGSASCYLTESQCENSTPCASEPDGYSCVDFIFGICEQNCYTAWDGGCYSSSRSCSQDCTLFPDGGGGGGGEPCLGFLAECGIDSNCCSGCCRSGFCQNPDTTPSCSDTSGVCCDGGCSITEPGACGGTFLAGSSTCVGDPCAADPCNGVPNGSPGDCSTGQVCCNGSCTVPTCGIIVNSPSVVWSLTEPTLVVTAPYASLSCSNCCSSPSSDPCSLTWQDTNGYCPNWGSNLGGLSGCGDGESLGGGPGGTCIPPLGGSGSTNYVLISTNCSCDC